MTRVFRWSKNRTSAKNGRGSNGRPMCIPVFYRLQICSNWILNCRQIC